MANQNRIILLGKVTENPQTKFGLEDNSSRANFVLAVERPARQDGSLETDFIPVVAWGKSADYTAEHLKQNSLVIVEGRVQVRTVEKDGQKEWITEVVASLVKAINGGATAMSGAQNSSPQVAAPVEMPAEENPFNAANLTETEDDVPF